jgi:hypothetical protein
VEEMEKEVSSAETSMKQLDTYMEKLYARYARGYLFRDDGDTPLSSPDTAPTPKSCWRFDEESSNNDDDF